MSRFAPRSQRFSFAAKRQDKREKEAVRENLWLRAIRISLSCYDRCHENRLKQSVNQRNKKEKTRKSESKKQQSLNKKTKSESKKEQSFNQRNNKVPFLFLSFPFFLFSFVYLKLTTSKISAKPINLSSSLPPSLLYHP